MRKREPSPIAYEAIGVVRSPHARLEGMPLQPPDTSERLRVIEVGSDEHGRVATVEATL